MSYYTDPLVTLLHGDCIEVMRELPADSVDAVVTDPPYGLEFMGKEWDSLDYGLPQENVWKGRRGKGGGNVGTDDSKPGSRHHVGYGGSKAGFKRCQKCGKRAFSGSPCQCAEPEWVVEYNPGPPSSAIRMQRWHEAWAVEALRVAKPGGYLLSFGGTRTHHRLVCALEDAGWIIRDELDWIYASGFPKGKANLKPAHEPIVLARKPGPLRPLAIDESRIPAEPYSYPNGPKGNVDPSSYNFGRIEEPVESHPAGRWPSNVLLSDPELFDEPNPYVVGSGAVTNGGLSDGGASSIFGTDMERREATWTTKDSGGYSRFFIVPKADRAERERGLADRPKVIGGTLDGGAYVSEGRTASKNGSEPRANVHPTVKPIDLMRHLVRLVTPSGGVVLDPFLGSGTTCLAASEEGFRSIGIERELEYLEIAKGRLMATPMGLGLDVGAPTRRRTVTDGYWPPMDGLSDSSFMNGLAGKVNRTGRKKPPEEVA